MQGVYSVEQVRAAEDALMARVPEGALMQRAAAGLATQCAALLGDVYGARVTLLVGAGNNGGDALYAGALLARRGAAVTALLLAPDRAHAGGLAALRRAGGRVRAADQSLVAADLVIDGMLGIGGHGGLRPDAAELAAAAGSSLTVAVDLPSGVDADTGAVPGDAVHADVTVTFGALKTGLVVSPGADLAGQVRLVDIGLELPWPDIQVLEAADARGLLEVPGPADDKYTRGVVGVVAGSREYGGAGVLCTGSALRGGAGMVRYAGTVPDAIRARFPEVVVQEFSSDLHVQAWVVGPGMGIDDAALELLRGVLASDVPVIVDADGLTLVAKNPDLLRRRNAPTVLTPHDREFERIFGEVGDDRVGAARRAADESGATVLLKGNSTVVASPDGDVYVNTTGTPWLATAGSGDVLSGLLGSILATGVDAPLAAAAAAHVHGVAGQGHGSHRTTCCRGRPCRSTGGDRLDLSGYRRSTRGRGERVVRVARVAAGQGDPAGPGEAGSRALEHGGRATAVIEAHHDLPVRPGRAGGTRRGAFDVQLRRAVVAVDRDRLDRAVAIGRA